MVGDYYFDPVGLFVESGETITLEMESRATLADGVREGDMNGEYNSGSGRRRRME